ncbi:translation initiation factor IF-2 N-terminal domain-containing protein, partial [Synechococcus sp. GreenBA-s]|nr:translation initiation factor IF-2 N-terminal domain-containing protein [Synechococcus sp. GreenBA-s]
MTSSGKVRIYELSRDLGLENKDVLEAAEKLSIAAKSHSSSISDDEASRIRGLITGNGQPAARPSAAAPAAAVQATSAAPATAAAEASKAILSVKKAAAPAAPAASAPAAAPAAPARPAA